MVILIDDKNTYTNDSSPGLQKLPQKDLLDIFLNDNASISTLTTILSFFGRPMM